jgi:hypothetical protein
MTVLDLILLLEDFNPHAKVSIYCSDTGKTKEILCLQEDEDPEHGNNFIDIVTQKSND